MTEQSASPERGASILREVVAVFPDEQSLDAAVDDLEEHGFDRAEISLMASERAVQDKLGERYQRVEDAADDPSTPRRTLVAPEDIGAGEGALIGGLAYIGAIGATGAVVASGGALLFAIMAAAAGGLGLGAIGGVFARRLGARHAREVEDHLRHGGLLLWVHAGNPDREATACRILERHSGAPARVHDIAADDPRAGPAPTLEPYLIGLPYLFRLRA